MHHIIGTVALTALGLVGLAGILLADEPEQLRERAQALKKEAGAHAERGDKDAAARLHNQAIELMEEAQRLAQAKERGPRRERPDGVPEVRQLEERLRHLRSMELKLQEVRAPGKELEQELDKVRAEVAKTERALHAVHQAREHLDRPDVRAQAAKLETAARRIHHLRVAAENLKLAEAHDLAEKIQAQAEAMEREVHAAKQKLAAQLREAREQERGQDVGRDLRAEIERLRDEVRELRQRLEKR